MGELWKDLDWNWIGEIRRRGVVVGEKMVLAERASFMAEVG
jgi:hypothetical protein